MFSKYNMHCRIIELLAGTSPMPVTVPRGRADPDNQRWRTAEKRRDPPFQTPTAAAGRSAPRPLGTFTNAAKAGRAVSLPRFRWRPHASSAIQRVDSPALQPPDVCKLAELRLQRSRVRAIDAADSSRVAPPCLAFHSGPEWRPPPRCRQEMPRTGATIALRPGPSNPSSGSRWSLAIERSTWSPMRPDRWPCPCLLAKLPVPGTVYGLANETMTPAWSEGQSPDVRRSEGRSPTVSAAMTTSRHCE